MQIGFIGLGKMGNRMVAKLLNENHDVIAWNRSCEKFILFKKDFGKELDQAKDIKDFKKLLKKPRIIWSMLPAGEPTEEIMQKLKTVLEKGDIVIDGANSHFKDTDRRYEELKKLGINFLGIGVSGGVIAAQEGYPMMIGGSKKAYEYLKPILETLSKPKGGFKYFGKGGAGHYIKMVHNAIEYGYMQSIGEGFEVLEKAKYKFDLEKVAQIYRKNSLISGFMMDRTAEVLREDPKLESLTGIIGSACGETVWTVEEADKMGVDLEIIKASLNFRKRSETDLKIQNSFTARMVSALRKAFGGHQVKKKV